VKITPEIHRTAEIVWTDLQRTVWKRAPEILPDMKPTIHDVGGALVSMMAKSDALELNRVLGLGTAHTARERMIDEIIGHYRTAKLKRFCVFLSPAARPAAIRGWLDKRGFVDIGNHIKVFREVKKIDSPPRSSDFKIRVIGSSQATDFARLVCRQYGWHEKRIPWLASMVGEPSFEHWMAFDGSRPVATGALYVRDAVGMLAWGATDTPFRRRGAQTALIHVRLQRARSLGLSWVAAETTEPVKGRPSMSFRNLIAAGFSAEAPIACLMWKAT
jgi:GNAT superfamily N-acetyltransferase